MTTDETPILDLSAALDRVEGDREFYAELVALLMSEFEISVQKMRALLEQNNSTELQSTAHAIKSALGNLGAMRCHKLAFALECCGRDAKLKDAPALLNQLIAEFSNFEKAYSDLSKGA
ncbi:MAG: Hpt domain-containing protein [Oligoflexia bacterium]|nr:Hpt domain-containing protein [Oligoflexia bacterium]